MGQSQFMIQVVDTTTGEVVEWAPGLKIEQDLIREVCQKVAARPVGFARTTARVVVEVEAALRDVLYALKANVSTR